MKVGRRALMARINRELEGSLDGGKLWVARGERSRKEYGRYFLTDGAGFLIRRGHVDLEQYGRELKVLRDWEVLAP